MINLKTSFAAALVTVGALCAGSAQAANVQWSVGINLPPLATVITSEPVYTTRVYAPEPDYAPAPAYYAPEPVYYEPSRVVVRREPVVVYRPAPVYAPRFRGPEVIYTGWGHGGRGGDHRDGGHDRFEHGRFDRDHDRADHRGNDHRGDDHRGDERRVHH